jgi:hypothetical protein
MVIATQMHAPPLRISLSINDSSQLTQRLEGFQKRFGRIRISAVENLTGRINKTALASAPSRVEKLRRDGPSSG